MDAQRARALGNPDGPPVGTPRLGVGALVRLRHKPSRARAILRTEWHFKKQTWTYVVETEGKHPEGFEPKFTEDQLLFEGNHDDERDGRLRVLRHHVQSASTDAERIRALFELLEHAGATWEDALSALSREAPTSIQASYYFHRLLGVPCEGGRSIIDPAYWLRVLQSRAINAADPVRPTVT